MRTVRYMLSLLALWLAVVGSAYSQTALQFVPMTPCRLLDTRTGSPLTGGQPLTIPVQGSCGIPDGAQAYSFNVTVVPRGLLDYLTLWPTGQSQPVVSTMNSYDGRIKAVAAIIPAGTGGAVDAYATNTTDLVLDINGYFASSSDSALAFYPVAPCRLYDTRGGNFIHAQQAVDFAIQNQNSCSIPSSAQAYSLNFTALPLNGYLNFLTAWPAGQTQPDTSTLNAPTGTVTANAALVQGGTDGKISVFAFNDTDLLIDVNGYFGPPGAPGQLALYTLSPCRVLDTRPMYFQGQQTVQVESSPRNAPAAAQMYVVNATVLPQGFLGYLTLWGQGDQPTVSTLNAWDGAVTSNLAIVPANTTDGTFQAFASDSTQLLIDIFSYMGLAPLNITTTSLPDGNVSQPYQAQLAASGGAPPYTWMVSSGSLPPGLTLGAGSGAITGTPTGGGIFPFTVQVTDTQNNTVSQPLSITVSAGVLMVTPTQLPNGTQGVGYAAALGAAGGVPPYTWSITSGSLPAGLTFNSSSDLISGTPTDIGTSSFTAQVTDALLQSASAPLQITITAPVNNGALNGNYAFSISGFQNSSPFFMVGSLVADGNGNITSGVLDLNTGSGSPQAGSPFNGTYMIGGNGVGTMALDAHTLGNFNFHLVLSGQSGGQLILDGADPNPRGSGALFVQNAEDFVLPPAGSYAVGLFGADATLNQYAGAGAFQVISVGAVNTGLEDMNDNGTVQTRPFSGQFNLPDGSSGRGQASFSFPPSVTNNFAYYVVTQTQFLVVSTDPVSDTDPLTLGSILAQHAGGFTKASLHGSSVFETTGLAANGGNPVADVVLGLANWDGNGNGSFSLDENQGGTITQQQVSQGTYNVAPNGRVTLTGFGSGAPILYLTNANQAFLVGQGASVASGILEPQSAPPPYNNFSIFGTYLGGTIDPAQSTLVDSVGFLLADGNGNMNGTENYSGPSGTGTQDLSATYQVDTTGRAVLTGTPAGFMYVISAHKVVLLPTGNNPVLSPFSTGVTN